MASTPKAKAKEPISIDAIIVCSKKAHKTHEESALELSRLYYNKLTFSGKQLSKADIFVIASSQCLPLIVNENKDGLEYKMVCDRLYSELCSIEKRDSRKLLSTNLKEYDENFVLMYTVGDNSRNKAESAGKIALGFADDLPSESINKVQYMIMHYWNNEKAKPYKLTNIPRLVDKQDIPKGYLVRMEKNAKKFLLLEYNPSSIANIGNIDVLKVQRKGKDRYIPFVIDIASVLLD